ncbi:hypothetical protein AAVH_41242, partial [Aphelenchoides avenae]
MTVNALLSQAIRKTGRDPTKWKAGKCRRFDKDFGEMVDVDMDEPAVVRLAKYVVELEEIP